MNDIAHSIASLTTPQPQSSGTSIHVPFAGAAANKLELLIAKGPGPVAINHTQLPYRTFRPGLRTMPRTSASG